MFLCLRCTPQFLPIGFSMNKKIQYSSWVIKYWGLPSINELSYELNVNRSPVLHPASIEVNGNYSNVMRLGCLICLASQLLPVSSSRKKK